MQLFYSRSFAPVSLSSTKSYSVVCLLEARLFAFRYNNSECTGSLMTNGKGDKKWLFLQLVK